MRGIVIAVVLCFVASSFAIGQGVGVSPYHHPELAQYRLLAGFGGNIGHTTDAPLVSIGAASYQLGTSVYGLSIVSSSNNSRTPPTNTMSEFDVLYGYAWDSDLAHYEARPQSFHVSVSSGLGFNTYSARWRRFGRRGFVPDSSQLALPPNSNEYSLALPIQIQAMYEPFSFAGIGVMLSASVSKLTPSYGGALVVQARY